MILVTGGAGYIGSHYVQYAKEQGEQVVVLDNLAYGHKEAVPDGVPFVRGRHGRRGASGSGFYRA